MIHGVTGHRDVDQKPGELDRFARLSVARMVCAGASTIITGMARGWDLAVAQACVDLRVPFWAAVPYWRQPEHWRPADKALWHALIPKAEHCEVTGTLATTEALHKRSYWIVDNCAKLWTLCDGTPSGTSKCVLYAEETGRKIVPLWQDWLEFRRASNA